MLLEDDGELTDATHAAEEAAYYLSDTMTPDERQDLLAVAASRTRPEPGAADTQELAAEALTLLSGVAGEVEEILRGPHASSELRIALRALRRGIGTLVARLGLEPNHLSDAHPTPLAALRRLRAGQ